MPHGEEEHRIEALHEAEDCLKSKKKEKRGRRRNGKKKKEDFQRGTEFFLPIVLLYGTHVMQLTKSWLSSCVCVELKGGKG